MQCARRLGASYAGGNGRAVAMAASSASGYWDLMIRLKSFQEVQLKGEVRDLKIASALHTGMQWKNRRS